MCPTIHILYHFVEELLCHFTLYKSMNLVESWMKQSSFVFICEVLCFQHFRTSFICFPCSFIHSRPSFIHVPSAFIRFERVFVFSIIFNRFVRVFDLSEQSLYGQERECKVQPLRGGACSRWSQNLFIPAKVEEWVSQANYPGTDLVIPMRMSGEYPVVSRCLDWKTFHFE